MTSAVTCAILPRPSSGTLRKDTGNDKGADFGLALECSPSEARAPIFGNGEPSKEHLGSTLEIDSMAFDIDEEKPASDQRTEADENIEIEHLLTWQEKLMEDPLQKVGIVNLTENNNMHYDVKSHLISDFDVKNNCAPGLKISNLNRHNDLKEEKLEIENGKYIEIPKSILRFEIQKHNNGYENIPHYVESKVNKQNDILAGDLIIEPIGTMHMNNITENLVEFVFKGLCDETPASGFGGSLPNHDFQPKIGTKYLRLHLEPQDLGPLTLCLRNDAEGLRVVVQTLASEVHQKLVEDKESILRELNEKGVLISDMQIQMHSGKDIQTASDVNEMSHRGSFDNKSSERGNSNKSDFAAPSDSDEQKKHSTDEKTLGTYI